MSGRRVELADLRPDDSELLFEWINDRELVLLNAPFSPVSKAEHREWFEQVGSRDDVAIFAIRSIEDGSLIGTCQLLEIDRRHQTAQLQIRIGVKDRWGQGMGTEAVGLLLDHAFGDLGLHRVELHVFATNERAIRAYEKAGFRHEGVLREGALVDGHRVDLVVMGILAGEHADEAGKPRG